MDNIDLTIIQKLTEDARTSFRKIAQELGISTETVINRYKKLQEKNVIRGSTVILNPKQLGYSAMVVFLIDVSHSLTSEIEVSTNSSMIRDKLIQMRNVIVATKTVGDHDLLAVGVARDFEHLIQFGADIAEIPGVKNIEISFWVRRTELCPKYFVV